MTDTFSFEHVSHHTKRETMTAWFLDHWNHDLIETWIKASLVWAKKESDNRKRQEEKSGMVSDKETPLERHLREGNLQAFKQEAERLQHAYEKKRQAWRNKIGSHNLPESERSAGRAKNDRR